MKRPANRQRGAATLINTVLLLGLITLVVFFANRDVISGRKTINNFYRTARAFEAAQAGVEWTLANLNWPQRITAQCTASTSTTAPTFRDMYLNLDQSTNGGLPVRTTNSYPNPTCSFVDGSGTLSCSCPSGTSQPTTAACTLPEGCPTFTVSFANVAADPTMVQVTVKGCSAAQAPCTGGSTAADATATVTQQLKLLSGLSGEPAAAITARQDVNFGSNAISATNTDPATNGITINAGGTISGFLDAKTLITMPGSPPTSSLVGNDPSLAALTEDQMFQTYIGMTKAQYAAQASTATITCGGVCNTTLQAAVNAGARSILVNGDMTLNSNYVYGSPTQPIVLVVNGNVTLQGTMQIYGVVYCESGTWDNTGGGNAQIWGAAIAEGSFTATGTPDPTYLPNVLKNLTQTTGDFARVPGGWKDF